MFITKHQQPVFRRHVVTLCVFHFFFTNHCLTSGIEIRTSQYFALKSRLFDKLWEQMNALNIVWIE